MAIYKRGQKSGEGKFNKPVELNEYKGDNPSGNGSGKGEELKSVWTSNDSPAVRGGSENRDKKGT
jgi:hypothetical protein